VLLTNDLASSGATLTKSGSGTITLGGVSSFSGLTTVSGGKLVFQGAKTGSGNISVAGSTTLGITATGSQVTPATLTTSAGAILEFNNVSSTTTALLAADTISAGGSITVNVNSGAFAMGQSYPLVSWTSGSPTFALGTLTGAGGNLSVAGNTLYLNITSLAYVWTGLTDGNWDTTTANNWMVNGVSQLWGDGNTALFDDSALGQTNVVLNAPVSPARLTVNSSAKVYSITSSGANRIGGSGSLTKSGNSTLTMSGGVNSFSGATTIGGGVLSVSALANGGAASDIGSAPNGAANLVLNGGALQYTGGAASVDRLFTLGTGNGAIDASGSDALNLNNTGVIALSGSGARTLTLRGSSISDNTLAAVLGDNGGATALAKSGSGKWIVTGNNTNSGAVTIAGGTLQVGAGGASGAVGSGNITANGSLIFNRTGTLTNGTISGSGSVTVDGGGKVVLPGNNSYTGGTTINSGSTLQVGNGGATGSLSTGNGIVNNGTLIFDTTGSFSYLGGGLISGTGNVIMRGNGGLVKIIGANSYTGWTLIEPGATLQPTEGNTGGLASPVVTNNGTLKFVNQVDSTFSYGGSIVGTGMVLKDGNNGNSYDIPLTGTNTYTGGTFIAHGGFILGDGGTPGAGAIAGDVVFTNSAVAETARSLTFNRPDDFTFPGLITYSASLPFGNRGIVRQNGSGMLTLTANNDYPGGTEINGGTLQVGNGGATGAIGAGPVTDNSLLIFNRSGSLTIDSAINGSGSIVKTGSGTVTLNALNLYSGSTTVSNGTLIINSNNASSPVMVYGGTLGGAGAFFGTVSLETGTTLAPGASASSIGTFTFNSDLTIGGNVAVKVNKSLAQSNDVVTVAGTLTKTGTGTLTVANLGPDLVVGDKFFLFNQALPNGNALTVTGAGATWQNDLATDGSITALTVTPQVNTNAPVVQVSVSGTSLSLAWPTNRGWTLQTNSAGLTAANQWFSYPGSETITNVSFIINPAKTNVFFRMVYTNTP
jgi:autotransporter-associated beta strand protein